MAPGSLLHSETLGVATPAARPPLPLSQFRARGFHHQAKRKLRFYPPLFSSAHESDFPGGPTRSSLRDKIVRSTKLRAWPHADSNSPDPRPNGGFHIDGPQRALEEAIQTYSLIHRNEY